ncbi:MAG TPA: YetF domain-containing protein [Dehalococcoidia bacterium]
MGYLIPDRASLEALVVPDLSLLEVVLRTSAVYLFLFFLLRGLVKRETAGIGVADILLLVLLADGVQNGLSGTYTSVTDSLAVAVTLILWSYALNYLSYRFPLVERLVKPAPVVLIRNGRLNHRAARQELLTHEEIMAHLRTQGIERIEDVKVAYVEPTGEITAVPRRSAGGRERAGGTRAG